MIWLQDRIGWGGDAYRRSTEQRWLDDERAVQDYPDHDGRHVWTILSSIKQPGPTCGEVNPDRPGGACSMPKDHGESPHVWSRGKCFVLSLTCGASAERPGGESDG